MGAGESALASQVAAAARTPRPRNRLKLVRNLICASARNVSWVKHISKRGSLMPGMQQVRNFRAALCVVLKDVRDASCRRGRRGFSFFAFSQVSLLLGVKLRSKIVEILNAFSQLGRSHAGELKGDVVRGSILFAHLARFAIGTDHVVRVKAAAL